MMIKEVLTFKPKEVSKKLLSALPERARDIIKKRYGLENAQPLTLEAIGQTYGITRERVRQIEEFTLNTIRKSDVFKDSQHYLAELKQVMEQYGGVVHEQEFLNHLDGNDLSQNHAHFLLVLGGAFTKLKEDEEFHHRWTVDPELAHRIEDCLRGVCHDLDEDALLPEPEMIEMVLKKFGVPGRTESDRERAKRWLKISKDIDVSPVGEWGLSKSPNVRVRGIRDYAFLVLRKHGSPMHFREVAKAIQTNFNKKANPATCHNELIKDKRFVLVGRGIYALAEWGYTRGVVRDVIKAILQTEGPLPEAEVLEKVMKERHVKPNTILVNLKNPKYFKKDKSGKYVSA